MAVIGGAGVPTLPQITINKSQTWVPPQDGVVCIHVVGAGGSGSVGTADWGGGGAGAYAKIPSLAVTTAGSFTLVVGIGGARVRPTSSSQSLYGNAGGSSTIAGTGITGTLTCAGGARGNYGAGGSNNAPGGAVSGSTDQGWAGYQGGTGYMAGGAVGIFATGNSSPSTAGTQTYGPVTDADFGGLAMSGYGAICGGGVKRGAYSVNLVSDSTGSDLCGGGWQYTTTGVETQAGDGGVGGGGGSGRGTSRADLIMSGKGGNGIILIQYLS